MLTAHPSSCASVPLAYFGMVKLHGIQLLGCRRHEVADEAGCAKRQAVHVLSGNTIHLDMVGRFEAANY